MDKCVPNQLLVPENYIVQPDENIPVSIIDYNKIEMTHLIHAGPLNNGLIQLADIISNLKPDELHPLEAEIKRDLELKQKAAAANLQMSSEIQSTAPLSHDFSVQKFVENVTPVVDSVVQLPTNNLDSVLSVSTKPRESTICNYTSVNQPVVLETKQFILVPDNSVLINTVPKETEFNKNITLNNNRDVMIVKEEPKLKEISADSDSENEEDDLEPVKDFEPDPDPSNIIPISSKEKPIQCYMCFKSFKQKKNMYAHIRKIHSTQPKIKGGILCPLCKMHTLRQEHLRIHLEALHGIKIEREDKLFTTMKEFLSWKECIEKETLSLYINKSSSKLLANNQQKTYYKCHRSGNYVGLKTENRKKKLKVQGSNKIGATCPAAIEATENSEGINVTFWKTHVGHENDIEHLVLTKEDRNKIMNYIQAGVSWDKILELVKKEASMNANPPSRLSIASMQDIQNVVKRCDKMQEIMNTQSIAPPRKENKPVKDSILIKATQELVIEKADMLLKLLQTTDVRPEFRPKVCLMIDNLISTVKRRAIKNCKKSFPTKQRGECIGVSDTDILDKDQSEQSVTDDCLHVNEVFSYEVESQQENTFKPNTNVQSSSRNSAREVSHKKCCIKC